MKKAILITLALIISVMGANRLAPIFIGPIDPMQGDEVVTGIAILIFSALWVGYQIAQRYAWQSIAAKLATPEARRARHKDAEIDLLDFRYRVLHSEVLERRGEIC